MGDTTWTVAAGSTLNVEIAYGLGMNFNGQNIALQGGGTITWNTMFGFNAGWRGGGSKVDGDGLVVNLKAGSGTDGSGANYFGGFTLQQGA